MAKLTYHGNGPAQIGTKSDSELNGSFFAEMHKDDIVDIPEKLANEVRMFPDAWGARGFELIEEE